MYIQFDVPIGETLLAVLLGFILAFISIQSAAETDINPTGTVAKVSQVVLAAIPEENIAKKQTTNLASGLIVAAAASQSCDMVLGRICNAIR